MPSSRRHVNKGVGSLSTRRSRSPCSRWRNASAPPTIHTEWAANRDSTVRSFPLWDATYAPSAGQSPALRIHDATVSGTRERDKSAEEGLTHQPKVCDPSAKGLWG